jgi:hypothetical protein
MRPPLERGNDLARTQTLARSGRIDEAIAATERHVGQGSRDAEFLRVRAWVLSRLQEVLSKYLPFSKGFAPK